MSKATREERIEEAKKVIRTGVKRALGLEKNEKYLILTPDEIKGINANGINSEYPESEKLWSNIDHASDKDMEHWEKYGDIMMYLNDEEKDQEVGKVFDELSDIALAAKNKKGGRKRKTMKKSKKAKKSRKARKSRKSRKSKKSKKSKK